MSPTLNVGFRSPLVTVTAWLVIFLATVGAGFVWLSPLAAVLFPSWAVEGRGLPWLAGVVIGHLPWALLAATLLALALLASATGLLLRLEWARRVFIGLLALMIAVPLAGLGLQHRRVGEVLLSTFGPSPLPAPPVGLGGLAPALTVVLTLAACAALAWLMRALMSDRVRREFA